MRLAVLVAVAVFLAGCGGGRTVRAEFASARGLVEGNDVRYGGAVVGSVDEIALTRRGTALVTLSLHDGAPAPRVDATATIRPADLLGDTYVAYAPGTAAGALAGTLPLARTVTVARLDDLLSTFDPGVRAGLRAVLVESGIALDERGGDLGRLTVAMRPALAAADGVVRSLASEREALGAVVADAERAAGPLAERADDAAAAVDRLARVVDATAERTVALGTGLDGLPATLRTLRRTSDRLGDTALAARPLAGQLADIAPALGEVAENAPSLLARARATIRAANPALGSLRRLLRDGRGTLTDADAGLRTLARVAPDVARLAAVLAPAAPGISKGFFDNFADQAAEPGTQPFDPFADPARAYWRGAAVFSCESFGVPVRPGCLRDFLGVSTRRRQRPPQRVRPAATPAPVATRAPVLRTPHLPAVPTVAPRVTKPVNDLLDFLLKP
ncbi:MAG: phospholipid/cholesterol/gamma-HCH transport system substrate-binding protein [Solirubrobacteraceae bacterium]|nr:phospholipid/cholesterol/gamma-HCH transport system substrate-binding protein [Solirubrobacteraceae bacterium]